MVQSLRKRVLEYARDTYGSEAEHLWIDSPDNAILRHETNRKWYAVFQTVLREKLGLAGGGSVEILNLKCDPILSGSLRMQEGFLPGYHMNKEQWISILLDGTVEEAQILPLLDLSYGLIAPKWKKRANRTEKAVSKIGIQKDEAQNLAGIV